MDSLDSDVVFYLTSNGLIVVLEGVNINLMLNYFF